MSKSTEEKRPHAVQRLRKKAGMSQQDLAFAAGVSIGTIHGIEQRTVTDARGNTLLAIAKVLGCTVEELIE